MEKQREQEITERAVAFYIKRLRLSVTTATKADCEDLSQEIRLRIMGALKRKAGTIGNVQAFIYQSAFYAYRQFRRKYCTVKANETSLDDDSVPAPNSVTIGDIALAETSQAIRQAVDGIAKERNRDICRMYFAGVTRTEIARKYGICVTRVTGILRQELHSVWVKWNAGEI